MRFNGPLYEVMEDRDTIQTTYPCGKEGKPLMASYHGGTHATFKLVEAWEIHLKACRTCNPDKVRLAVDIQVLTKAFQEAVKTIHNTTKAIDNLNGALQEKEETC